MGFALIRFIDGTSHKPFHCDKCGEWYKRCHVVRTWIPEKRRGVIFWVKYVVRTCVDCGPFKGLWRVK